MRPRPRPRLQSLPDRPAPTRLVLAQPGTDGRESNTDNGTEPGSLHGGWWPRPCDIRTQLPDLITDLAEHFGSVVRQVGVLARNETPQRITVAGHVVRVGRFTDTNHVIVVTLGHFEHVRLLLVPSEATEQAALAALAMSASSQSDALSAQEILERCGIGTDLLARHAQPIASAA